MRYVTIPPPCAILDPLSDEPVPEGPKSWSFARGVRLALVLIAGEKGADVQTLRDIRENVDRAAVGSTIELSDDEWKLIEPHMRRPNAQAYGAAWVFSAEEHQRAWLDAPSKRPAMMDGVQTDSKAPS